jgi:mono/diheme cytochrome c family protein
MIARAALAFGIGLACADAAQAERPMATLYTWHCSGCHGASGHGIPKAGIPDLAYSGAYLAMPQGRAYLIQVPGISQSKLGDATAAAMLNWVLARFSAANLPANFKPYSTAEIRRLRANVASDAETQREVILAGLRKMGKLPADYVPAR